MVLHAAKLPASKVAEVDRGPSSSTAERVRCRVCAPELAWRDIFGQRGRRADDSCTNGDPTSRFGWDFGLACKRIRGLAEQAWRRGDDRPNVHARAEGCR